MNVPRRLSDDESQAMLILNHILNGTLHSRIQGEARRLGLVYGIWSEASSFEHNSSWDFGAEVNEDKINALFDIIVTEIQKVKNGEVLVRQTGATKIAGPGTYMSRNFTIHAAKDGVVTFVKTKKTHFSGKSLPRVRVEVR